MTTITPTAIRAPLRQVVLATIFTAAVAVGSSAFGHLAIAHAGFNSGDYQRCLQQGGAPQVCCDTSGGVWAGERGCQDPLAGPPSAIPPPPTVQPTSVGPTTMTVRPPATIIPQG